MAELLADNRRVRNISNLPALSTEQILGWADAHHKRTRQWPKLNTGSIPEAKGESWSSVNSALRRGIRGLTGGSSLAQMLLEKRNVRNHLHLPKLAVEQILAWADTHHAHTGQWPTTKSGLIEDTAGENWAKISAALVEGLRGLSPGSSLAQLLAQHRGVRNTSAPPSLTIEQILKWAHTHYERTGKWPRQNSGSIPESHGETWTAVELALSRGRRGLLGNSSLAQLLAAHRGLRNKSSLPELTVQQVLLWAHAHHLRVGDWPQVLSGPICDVLGETWSCVDQALRKGLRGLPGGTSCSRVRPEPGVGFAPAPSCRR